MGINNLLELKEIKKLDCVDEIKRIEKKDTSYIITYDFQKIAVEEILKLLKK